MGLFDAILGRRKIAGPAPDRAARGDHRGGGHHGRDRRQLIGEVVGHQQGAVAQVLGVAGVAAAWPVYRVHVAVAGADGELVAWHGDPLRVTTLRSAAKPFQAEPLVESGQQRRVGGRLGKHNRPGLGYGVARSEDVELRRSVEALGGEEVVPQLALEA